MAVANYVDEYGCYPPAFVADESGQPLLSWRVLLLPYMDHAELFKQFDLNEPWGSPANASLLEKMPSLYRLHTIDDDHHSSTNYVAIVGKETMWSGAEGRASDFATDGDPHTLLIAEFVGHSIPWTKPEDLLFSEMDMRVDSDNGISSVLTPPAYLTVDGFVGYLPADMDEDSLRALLTAQGGEEPTPFVRRFDGRLRPRKRG